MEEKDLLEKIVNIVKNTEKYCSKIIINEIKNNLNISKIFEEIGAIKEQLEKLSSDNKNIAEEKNNDIKKELIEVCKLLNISYGMEDDEMCLLSRLFSKVQMSIYKCRFLKFFSCRKTYIFIFDFQLSECGENLNYPQTYTASDPSTCMKVH